MSEQGKFYKPDEVKPLYGEIVPAYQAAFAGEPWYEVSKCADEQQRCVGGLSALAIGSMCAKCEMCPSSPAYETDELIRRFDTVAVKRPTAWYAEQNAEGLTMAAVAWREQPSLIADEKYPDVPEMFAWLGSVLGDTQIMWLDEVFANKNLNQSGNLQNFGLFVRGLATQLGTEKIAYRTISPQMIGAARRDFGNNAQIFAGDRDRQKVEDIEVTGTVPDRRDFILIRLARAEER